MKKYFAVAKITFANILQYRWEYLIAQTRAILLLVTLYFLWSNVFQSRINLFNFNQEQIITYVLLAIILRQFILNSAAGDQIAGELQSWGKFFSYLLRPIGYFRYWFTVDAVYKFTSLISIILFVLIFIRIFNITLSKPTGFLYILLFTIAAAVAILIYFYIGILVSTAGFWTSQVWGLQFFVVLILEFSAGAYFPIDVLPSNLQFFIKLTPFPYLLYYPTIIFLGKLTYSQSVQAILIATSWLLAIFLLTRLIWNKSLKAYEAWGG